MTIVNAIPAWWGGTTQSSWSGNPIGVVTPSAIGEMYFDTSTSSWYISTGLTVNDRAQFMTATP